MKWITRLFTRKGEKMAQVKNYSQKDVAFRTEAYTN